MNRVNDFLFKIENFVNIYYDIFDSDINYSNMIRVRVINPVNRVSILQEKPLRIISFQQRDCHSSFLFKKHNLLKFEDNIQLENALLVSKYFNNIVPSVFDNWYFDIHNCNTDTSACKLFKPWFRTNIYRKTSVTISAVNAWNKIQTAFGDTILKNLTTTKIKTLPTKKWIDKYWQIFVA